MKSSLKKRKKSMLICDFRTMNVVCGCMWFCRFLMFRFVKFYSFECRVWVFFLSTGIKLRVLHTTTFHLIFFCRLIMTVHVENHLHQFSLCRRAAQMQCFIRNFKLFNVFTSSQRIIHFILNISLNNVAGNLF